jgi:hypothetical protein
MICKIESFHGDTYEECRLLEYRNSVRTSEETYYMSTTEAKRLIIRKIEGFQGDDYEECRLMRYRNAVLTSEEAYYISTTEHKQLIICKIEGFHDGNYDKCRFWDLLQCGSCRTRRFAGRYHLHIQGGNNQRLKTLAVASDSIMLRKMTNKMHSPKRRFLQEPHGNTCWKTAFFL